MNRLGRFDITSSFDAGEKLARFSRGEFLPDSRFVVIENLGTVRVPSDYVSISFLDLFRATHRLKFSGYDDRIADRTFPRPNYLLSQYELVRVVAFGQKLQVDRTSATERMALLETLGSVQPGVRGLALTFDQNFGRFPTKPRFYQAFGDSDELFADLLVHAGPLPDLGCSSLSFLMNEYSAFLGFFPLT